MSLEHNMFVGKPQESQFHFVLFYKTNIFKKNCFYLSYRRVAQYSRFRVHKWW